MLKPLKKLPWRKPAGIPKGLRLYAVGDVHGRADALRDVLARIDDDIKRRPAERAIQVFLGDYVDRGPQSREVLNLLIARHRTHELLPLKGNHEVMFLDFFKNPSMLTNWRQQGGLQTLMSYGLKPSLNPGAAERQDLASNLGRSVPPEHLQFIAGLPTSFKCGDFYFVHAGIRPGVALGDQRDDDLLWIREEFLLHEREYEKIIVHGHTPVPEPDVRTNRVNLDVGAYATGRLACMVIEGSAIGFI